MITRIKKVKSDLERIQNNLHTLKPTDYDKIVVMQEIGKRLTVAMDSVDEVERYLEELEEDSGQQSAVSNQSTYAKASVDKLLAVSNQLDKVEG